MMKDMNDFYEIYAAMFGLSKETLIQEINKVIENYDKAESPWVGCGFWINTPSAKDLNDYCDEREKDGLHQFEFDICCEKNGEKIYPIGELLYWDDCICMCDDENGSLSFDLDCFIDEFYGMVYDEIENRPELINLPESKQTFDFYSSNSKNPKTLTFDEIKAIADELKETRDINVFIKGMGLEPMNEETMDGEIADNEPDI